MLIKNAILENRSLLVGLCGAFLVSFLVSFLVVVLVVVALTALPAALLLA